MDTNVVARVIQNHETHDTKIEQRVIEPRMDTNGHECRAQGGSTTCHLGELCVTWNYHATCQMGEY